MINIFLSLVFHWKCSLHNIHQYMWIWERKSEAKYQMRVEEAEKKEHRQSAQCTVHSEWHQNTCNI